MGEQLQNDGCENKDANNPTPPEDNNPPESHDQAEDPNEEDMDPEEFQRLDNQLDALFTALDDIESKNDNIHAQLLDLLQANREVRKQLMEEKGTAEAEDTNNTQNN